MHLQPWNLVFLAGFIVYVTIRGVYKQRTKNNELAAPAIGQGSRRRFCSSSFREHFFSR